MSKKILMRLGKIPTEVISPWESFRKNSIGGNNGNLIFGYAAHKLLSASNVTVDANHYRIGPGMADEINAKYDAFVLPLANAFRPSFQDELKRTTQLIQKLKIPFLMLSGGAQLPLDGNPVSLKPIEQDVKAFASAVLDKSAQLSVRGEMTAEYFSSLGFKDVEVIGCPSMTLLSNETRIQKSEELSFQAKIAFNIETSKDLSVSFFEHLMSDYDSFYFPQDRKTLEMLLWGNQPYKGRSSELPLSIDHAQFKDNKAEFHLDAPTWINRMRDFDFSLGPRIHGNIASILAGTPAVVLAHDSRTLELAQYHDIPYHVVETSTSKIEVEQLYGNANYEKLNNNFKAKQKKLFDYLERNGFEHIYDPLHKNAKQQYEKAIEYQSFPAPVSSSLLLHDVSDNRERVDAIHTRFSMLENQVKTLQKQLKATEQKYSELVQLKNEIRALHDRLNTVETRMDKILRIPRKLKRTFRRRSNSSGK